MSKVCFIIGVGLGIGMVFVECFVQGGYCVVMMVCSVECFEEFVVCLVKDEGGDVYVYLCDVVDFEVLIVLFECVFFDFGMLSIVVYNVVVVIFGSYFEIELDDLCCNFEVNIIVLLYFVCFVIFGMIEVGFGVIFCIGNILVYCGKFCFVSFVLIKVVQCILFESIVCIVGLQGIYVVYIVIDVVIDFEWMCKVFVDKLDDFFCQFVDIVDECYCIVY